jgi:hypothetical protein
VNMVTDLHWIVGKHTAVGENVNIFWFPLTDERNKLDTPCMFYKVV